MITLSEMKANEANCVLAWNIDSEDFLMQWSNFTYPLTENQIVERINSDNYYVYSIYKDTQLVGTIQIFKINKANHSAKVGCFLINEKFRSTGIGADALMQTCDLAFNNLHINTISLGVYDFNKGAQKCYEKCGFVKVSESIRPNGWVAYVMELQNPNQM